MRIGIGVALLVLGAVPACSATSGPAPDPSGPPRARPAETATLACTDPIGRLSAPIGSYQGRLDAVALDTAVVGISKADEDAPHRYFAKTGLMIRADRSAVVSLPDEWAERVTLTWGTSTRAWTTHLQIPACERAATGWLVFPGGFSVDAPACVPLQIRTGDQLQTFHVAVGTACSPE